MQQIEGMVLSVWPSAALFAHRFVTLAGAHGAEDVMGVAQTDSESDLSLPVAVATSGTVKVEVAEVLPIGTLYVKADAEGKAVPATKADALGKLWSGNRCHKEGAAVGQLVEVLLAV